MATQTSFILQNENVHVPKGKGIEGAKADLLKPEKKERKDRKALADLSKPAKADVPIKGSTLKQKSSLRGNEATKKTSKSSILTDEEIKKCREWAKEGIEKVHFTGTDLQKHDNDAIQKCVQENVDMVMSSMSKWNHVLYDYATPVKKTAVDIGDIRKLEPEPEVPLLASSALISGFGEGEYPIPEEQETLWIFYEPMFEPKLKEDEGNASF